MGFIKKIIMLVLLTLVVLNAEDINSEKTAIKSNQLQSSNISNSIESMKIAFFPLKKSNAAVFRAKIKPFTNIDSKVISFRNNNTVVIMARPKTLKRIQKVFDNIESLELNKVIIVKLQNASIEDVYENMYSISKLLYSDKITSEKVDVLKYSATNSLIFVGKKENINQLLEHLKLLDVKADPNFKRRPKVEDKNETIGTK